MYASGMGTITEMHAIFNEGALPTPDDMSEYVLLNNYHNRRQ